MTDRALAETLVRDATEGDAEACAQIYAPYVTRTAITFETDPPSSAEMAERIAAASREHAWLVLEDGGRVAGYAYGGPSPPRARCAQATSCHAPCLKPMRR